MEDTRKRKNKFNGSYFPFLFLLLNERVTNRDEKSWRKNGNNGARTDTYCRPLGLTRKHTNTEKKTRMEEQGRTRFSIICSHRGGKELGGTWVNPGYPIACAGEVDVHFRK